MAEHVALWDLLPIAVLVLGVPWIRVHPVAALALWFACLAAWHVPAAFDAANRHDALHVAQHASFFLVGLTMWVPALRSSLALPLRLAYVLAMQLGGLVLANVLLWSSALYDRYRVGDQRVAGGILLLEGSALLIAVFAWLFLKLASEPDVPEPT
jgi:putative membrane protein